MRARFVGRDGSMGYRCGEVYLLDVRSDSRSRPVILAPQACPYGSWRAFRRNWEVL